jgi:hypothetical protein
MPISGLPNGPRHIRPQASRDSPGMGGRDQSMQVVAINRNLWSRSSGARKPFVGHHQSLPAEISRSWPLAPGRFNDFWR